tara:strand:- start:1014 stop:1217 length:204 start_codon:yes stop_codon:yes gene_type:complete
MFKGKVKWFSSQKGYGFITPEDGSKDVFVHRTAVEKAGLTQLSEGQDLVFEKSENNGKISAVNLKTE